MPIKSFCNNCVKAAFFLAHLQLIIMKSLFCMIKSLSALNALFQIGLEIKTALSNNNIK